MDLTYVTMVEGLTLHSPHLGTKAMRLAEEGALTRIIAIGIVEIDLVLSLRELQGTDLVPLIGIPLLGAMEFSFSG